MAPAKGRGIVVAQFAGSHGVRGEFKLRSFTEEPAALFGYGTLISESGATLTPTKVRLLKPGLFIARAEEITSPEASDAFKSQLLTVPRDRLPPTEEDDEFYIADLIGLVALLEDGRAVGEVKAVPNYGAGDLVEIVSEGKALVLPFTKDAVPSIDFAAGTITVRLPEDDGEASSAEGD
ncbi:MAG: ribosome maturation factor RimM [Parvularcula sp.]|jgi:16S rRNA processing protein RimM|nr:ribosome maturation factor RimM [Parvularcula sp.]